MPKDGFKDRIYYVEQDTDEECEKDEAKKDEAERIERLRSTYNGRRAYGSWIPKTREKIDSATS